MKKTQGINSNTRYSSNQRSGRGTKNDTLGSTSSQRSLYQNASGKKASQSSSSQLIIDQSKNNYCTVDLNTQQDPQSLDNKIQALLDQNTLLNEKLKVKIQTDQSQKLTMSDDIDLSWSTPRLLEEDYGDKDFSINVGSCIKRNSISGTYYKIQKGDTLRSIFQRMVQLESIIEDQDRTIGELKQIYKENIINTNISLENKMLVTQNMDLKRKVSIMGTKIARYQEFEQNIEPQVKELAQENEKLTEKLMSKILPSDYNRKIRALEQEIRDLKCNRIKEPNFSDKTQECYTRILTSSNMNLKTIDTSYNNMNTKTSDTSYINQKSPISPTKQTDKYQAERSSELMKRLNTLSQNLINCAKTIKQ